MEKYIPQGFSEIIFKERYAAHKNETWEEACKRVASCIARAETNGKVVEWEKRFYDLLIQGKFCPGGRILYGAGRPKQQLLNCFVINPEDSREGWGRTVSDMIVISGTGGGVGMNGSSIRPRGTKISGTGGEATGAVSFFDIINAAGETIKAGGGRRTALMLCLDIAHPDVIEFIDKKFTKTKIDSFNEEQVEQFIKKEFGLYSLPKSMKKSVKSFCEDKNKNWDDFIKDLSDVFLQKNLKNANVSIVFSEDPVAFFDKVKNNEEWQLKWKDEVVSTVKARDLWLKIISNFLDGGEPGILNGYLANKMNNIHYHKELVSTNPCLTYDSLVYVADGRGNVKIGDLAKEGKDVPVFCLDDKNQVVVRTMRNPRKTGENKKVLKLTLDDGSVIKITENHKFKLKSGNYVEAKDLKSGDSLYILTRYEASIKDIFPGSNSRSKNYFWISKPEIGSNYSEHRIIAESFYGKKIKKGEVVHHIDYDSKNNDPLNLKIMTKKDHDNLHRKDMIGDKNPMIRGKKEWSVEKWNEIKTKHSNNSKGEKNSNFSGITNEEIKKAAIELASLRGRRFSISEWQLFAAERNYPKQFSAWRSLELGSITSLSKWAAKEAGLPDDDFSLNADTRIINTIQQAKKQGYDLEIKNSKIYVKKNCEICHTEFSVPYERREASFCSHSCVNSYLWKTKRKNITEGMKKANKDKRDYLADKQLTLFKDLKFRLKRDPLKKEWQTECKNNKISCEIGRKSSPFFSWQALKDASENFNHRVVSVEECGFEDVYNGTVDDFHNFFVGAFAGTTQNGKNKWQYLNNLQCGEIWLENYGCCCLGALTLSKFLNETKTDYDWESLAQAVTAGVRFLDNVLTVNNYPLKEIEQNCQEVRRIGLGVMALHDSLLMMGIKYSSEDGLKKIDQLFDFIKNKAYEASTYLAVEKGSFPKLDREEFLKSGFCKTLKKSVREKIKEHGIRNCALLTIAPTGTTSILMGSVSSGIEPIFSPAWNRMYYSGDEKKQELVFHPLFVEMYKQNKNLEHFESSYGIPPEIHMKVQAICQKHIDNAVSKTINIPSEGYSLEDFSNALMEYVPRLKGLTVYKAGSRGDEPLQAIPINEAIDLINRSNDERVKSEVDNEQLLTQDCPNGICSI